MLWLRKWNSQSYVSSSHKHINIKDASYDLFISIQPWRLGLAGTRAQSCDRYGSGTLHPERVLGGSLPLLSPALRHSYFSHQVPPSATTREILAAKGGTVGQKDVILPKFQLPRKFRENLHAANLRHGTNGFTSPPKEGVVMTFCPRIPPSSAGFERANLGIKGQHATARPPKPSYDTSLLCTVKEFRNSKKDIRDKWSFIKTVFTQTMSFCYAGEWRIIILLGVWMNTVRSDEETGDWCSGTQKYIFVVS